MTTEALSSRRNETKSLLYALLHILSTVAIAGKRTIAWILMKLYEIFIQKNPVDMNNFEGHTG